MHGIPHLTALIHADEQGGHVDALAHKVGVLVALVDPNAVGLDADLGLFVEVEGDGVGHQRTLHGGVVVLVGACPVAPVVLVPVHPAEAGEDDELQMLVLDLSQIIGIVHVEDQGVAVEVEAGHVALLHQLGDGLAADGDEIAQGLAGDGRGAEIHGGDGLQGLGVLAVEADVQGSAFTAHVTGLHARDALLARGEEGDLTVKGQMGQLPGDARRRAGAPDKARLDRDRHDILGLQLTVVVHVEDQIGADGAVGVVVVGVAGTHQSQIAQMGLDLADGLAHEQLPVLFVGEEDEVGVVVDISVPRVLGQTLDVPGDNEADPTVVDTVGAELLPVHGGHLYRLGGGGDHRDRQQSGEEENRSQKQAERACFHTDAPC